MGNDNGKNRKTPDKKVTLYDENKNQDDVVFSDSNNRTDKRIKVSTEVTLSGPHTFFSGFMMDISKGGLFVATHRIYPIGTEFLLNLKVGDHLLEILTKVVWIRNVNSSGISGESPGMGLKFIDIDDRSLKIINSFIREKEPLLYDDEL